jgi:hypothetical protein
MELSDLIRSHSALPRMVEMQLTRAGKTLTISARSVEPFAAPAIVQLVRYTAKADVDIERGENAGRRIAYANIVRSWQPIAEWDGAAPLSLTVEAPGDEAAVVIVQKPGPGAILAAARLR